MRALWIEISYIRKIRNYNPSRPVRALWIEMISGPDSFGSLVSRPVRALWIEILASLFQKEEKAVEAREGLVD